MRSVTVKGLDDGVRLELDGDVGLICAVMEIGRVRSDLIYEATLTGRELGELIAGVLRAYSLPEEIKDENRYVITAYDW